MACYLWFPEYDKILERISSTDVVDVGWPKLRNIIKYRINENIAVFLADARAPKLTSIYVPPFSPHPSTKGGLKLPPFPSRERNKSYPNEAPKAHFTPGEAAAVKKKLFAQLDDFDDTPFTIQRLVDLCMRPRENYTALGKYCRALEKTLYVKSLSSSSAPSSPLVFSPISFLHDDDARRSHSAHSPPPLPLNLDEAETSTSPSPHAESLGVATGKPRLVDELDGDPNPAYGSGRKPYFLTIDGLDGEPPAVPTYGTASASVSHLLYLRNEVLASQLAYRAALAALDAVNKRRRTAWQNYLLVLGLIVADRLSLRASSASDGSPVGRKRKRRATSPESDVEDDDGEDVLRELESGSEEDEMDFT